MKPMEQLIPEPKSIDDTLYLAQANREEIIRGLKSLDQKGISTLMEKLSSIPGSIIKHPFGYYEIPLFVQDLDQIKSKIPVQLVDDDDELWKKHSKARGVVSDWKACIRSSWFDPVFRITTIICRDFDMQAVEQVIEHEIREVLRLKRVFGLPYIVAEGFAQATYCGYGGIWRTKKIEDVDYWRNVFQLLQEKGYDDVDLVQEIGQRLKPPYHPVTSDEEFRHHQRVTKEFIEEIGDDRPTKGYVQARNTNWDMLRYNTFITTKRFLESQGITLNLESEQEHWEKFLGIDSQK